MSTLTMDRLTGTRHVARRTPGPTLRIAVLASIVITFLAASAAPTPLYQHYDAVWHGTPLTTTMAFGIYALAVLAGLLTLGEVAEHVGRRPVLLGAVALQMAALVLIATAGSFEPLFVGRVVQGVAAGAALGTLGAAMIDAHPVRGAAVNAAAPDFGTGAGALVAGLVVALLPWPTHLIYLGLAAALLVQAALIVMVVEATPRRPLPLSGLRPRVAVPARARSAFLAAVPVMFSVWALAGFYGSLGPALTRLLSGSEAIELGGLALFVLAGVAAVTTIVLRHLPGRSNLVIGAVGLLLGAAATAAAVHEGTFAGFVVATVVAGVGFGAGFQGSMRTVVPLAEAHQRAGLLSAVFVASYLGLGVPAVGAGWLVSRGHALTTVATGYDAVLVVLALASLAGLALTSRRRPAPGRHVAGRAPSADAPATSTHP